MKVNVAKHAGFCFGVKRAIDIALNSSRSGRKIEMLGDIVHNETAVRQLQAAGIRKIARLGNGENKALLIRAHGAAARTFSQARQRKYKIIDATCPMVKEIHRIVRKMAQGGYNATITIRR